MTNYKAENQLLNPTEIEAQENGRKTKGFFPIANSEIKKLICIGGITFSLSFAYSSSRQLKDAYFLEKLSTTAMSYIKLFFVLPLNIFVNISISILLNIFSVESIFSALTVFYAIFFMLMGLVLIPFRNTLEMSVFTILDLNCDRKIDFYGGLNGILPIFYLCGYWIVSLNYCLIEVFSSTVFAYLMFTFFNYICDPLQFKRFISLIFIFCNLATIVSGLALNIAGKVSNKLPYKKKQRVYYIYFIAVATFCLIAFIFQYIINKYYNQNMEKKTVKKKEKPSIGEALKVLLTARIIMGFSVMVLFYAFLSNIIEMDYKSNLKRYHSVYLNGKLSFQELSSRFNSVTLILTGSLVILIMLSSLKNSVGKFGWIVVGMVTPIFMLLGGLIILVLSILNYTKSANDNDIHNVLAVKIGSFFGIKQDEPVKSTNLMLSSLWTSCIIISLFKCCKYAFFDISKEALSMLIDKEHRAKYKSIYDGICGKLGKSFSSIYVIFWSYCLSTNEVNELSVISTVFVILLSVLWCLLVVYVGSAYNTSVSTGKPLDLGISKNKGKINL